MKKDFARLLEYIRPHWKILLVSLIFSILLPFADVFFPWFLKQIIDSVIAKRTISTLLPFIFILLFLYISRSFFNFMAQYRAASLGAKVGDDFKNELFLKLLKLSINFYEERSTGKIMSSITDDLAMIEILFGDILKSLIQNSIMLLGCLCFMFYLDWRLFLIAAVSVPIINSLLRLFGKRFQIIANKSQDKKMELSNILQEAFSSIRVIKAYTSEDREINRFKVASKEYLRSILEWEKHRSLLDSSTSLFNDLGVIIVLWYGISLMLQNKLSVGTLVAFIVLCQNMIPREFFLNMIPPI
jgi:subfamily B ATP-binding cassette protein MsbA